MRSALNPDWTLLELRKRRLHCIKWKGNRIWGTAPPCHKSSHNIYALIVDSHLQHSPAGNGIILTLHMLVRIRGCCSSTPSWIHVNPKRTRSPFCPNFIMTREGEEGLWLLSPEDNFGGKTFSGPWRSSRICEDLWEIHMGSGKPSSEMQGLVFRSKNSLN